LLVNVGFGYIYLLCIDNWEHAFTQSIGHLIGMCRDIPNITRLVSYFLISGIALLAVPEMIFGESTVTVSAAAQGLDKSLAQPLEESLKQSAEEAVEGITTTIADGQSPDIQVSVRFEGSASASRPYATTASGELVLKTSPSDPGTKTGKAGLRHSYCSRFSYTGRLVFTVQKRDGAAYKTFDSWIRPLRPVSEEKFLNSIVVAQNGDPRSTQANPDAYRESAATQFREWLPQQLAPSVAEALKQRWLACELIAAQSDGHKARIRLKVSNKSPWPLKEASIAIIADAGNQNPFAIGTMTIAHLSTGPLKTGESRTVESDDSVLLEAGPTLPGKGPAALPRNFRASIVSVAWQPG